MTSSERVTFQAWIGPGLRPRLSNQFAIPGPERVDCRCRQPWAKIMIPSHTRASANARFTTSMSFTGLPLRLGCEATRSDVG